MPADLTNPVFAMLSWFAAGIVIGMLSGVLYRPKDHLPAMTEEEAEEAVRKIWLAPSHEGSISRRIVKALMQARD